LALQVTLEQPRTAFQQCLLLAGIVAGERQLIATLGWHKAMSWSGRQASTQPADGIGKLTARKPTFGTSITPASVMTTASTPLLAVEIHWITSLQFGPTAQAELERV
jgi:hypothetical protein